MRKAIASLIIILTLAPYVAIAVPYGGSQAADLVDASNQSFERASFTDSLGNTTVEGWVQWPGTVNAGSQTIATKADDAAGGGGNTIDWNIYVLKSGSDTIFVFGCHTGVSYDESAFTDTGDQTIFNGSPHHIRAVLDVSATTAEFFVDGVSQGTGNTTICSSIRSSTRKLYLGARGTNQSNPLSAEAYLANVRIWSTKRTTSDVDYCSFLGATTNLLAEYPLNGAATDNSGNGLDLTAINSPTYVSFNPTTLCPPSTSLLFFHPF